MMFTEHTGLKNAYEMIDFAIDGISCRRDLISKHFLDVWSESAECNKMCDRCYYKDSVHPPKMIITDHCLSLYKIIDHAADLDVKLTFLKLLDAWYHKGKPNLRNKDVPVPDFERFYAEQMIAFLITKGYLKEDFHFSSYTTYSYIKKGSKMANNHDRIVFYGARVLKLPEIDEKQWNDDDCVLVSTQTEPPQKKIKKGKSLDRDRLDDSVNDSAHKLNSSKSLKKKSKSEKHHLKHKTERKSGSSIKGEECPALEDGNDVIEID